MSTEEEVVLDGKGEIATGTAAEERLAAIKAGKGPLGEGQKCPEGHVERRLTYRDRDLIFQAIRAYAAGDKRADYKTMKKVHRLETELQADECADYFEAVEERTRIEIRDWLKAKNAYLGEGKGEDPGRKPEPSKKEQRGDVKRYALKSTLDTWMIEAVKDMKWNPILAEYVVELCDRLGLKDED
jgi:hypothetical protein